jgi:hypothetical protein
VEAEAEAEAAAAAAAAALLPTPSQAPVLPQDPAAIARQNLLDRIRAARANAGSVTGKLGK